MGFLFWHSLQIYQALNISVTLLPLNLSALECI